MSQTLFDTLNNIFEKKSEPYDPKVVGGFMLSMWLSHDNNLLRICNRINRFHFMVRDKTIYDYYFHAVPKGRRFLRWVKKDKEASKDVQKIAKEHGISIKEAKQFV